jgi:hypothetical protein
MRTPAGKECSYFYGNYFRGRSQEECRLLGSNNPPIIWKRELCNTCPVPGIQLANTCPYMVLKPKLVRKIPFGKQEVRVQTFCRKTERSGFDPHIGCGECHKLPPEFEEGFSDSNPV